MYSADCASLASVYLTEALLYPNPWAHFFTNWLNTVVIPKTTFKPVSIPSEKTWCTSKDGPYIAINKCRGASTTKGGAKNQFTISKVGYTQNTCTRHTIFSHHNIRGPREESQYYPAIINGNFIIINRDITKTSILLRRRH